MRCWHGDYEGKDVVNKGVERLRGSKRRTEISKHFRDILLVRDIVWGPITPSRMQFTG